MYTLSHQLLIDEAMHEFVQEHDSCQMLCLHKVAFIVEFICYCMTSVFKTSLRN